MFMNRSSQNSSLKQESNVELYGKNPKNNPDYLRIISVKEAKRLVSLIDPAKVICGGASDSEVRYIDPTILYPISWGNKIMKDEVFGPILPVLNTKCWMRFSLKLRPRRVPGGTFIFSRDGQVVIWKRRGEPRQYSSVHRNYAVRRCRAIRHGWEVWIRSVDARQIHADFATGCRYRPSLSALSWKKKFGHFPCGLTIE
jgi:hypothetical protein